MSEPAISQRDLRLRSKEIMDSVEGGQRFTVTRDGHEIGKLIPLRRKYTFIPRDEFMALGRGLPEIDAERFRTDVDAVIDPYVDDPFTR
ncbi:MAG: prevent-host-death protein [Micrococcales bacterium]|nr:prevent-host-death protein [Micrococcales bacterium]